MSKYAVVTLIIFGLNDGVSYGCHRCHPRKYCCCTSAAGSGGRTLSTNSAAASNGGGNKIDSSDDVSSGKKTNSASLKDPGKSSTGGANPAAPASDLNVDARLVRIEGLLGLSSSVKTEESALLAGGLVAGLVGEAIRELTPTLIEELRTVTRKRFNLPPTAPAPAPAAQPPALTVDDLTKALNKQSEDLKKELPKVMLDALKDETTKKDFKKALGI